MDRRRGDNGQTLCVIESEKRGSVLAPVRERAHGEMKCGPGSAPGTFTVRWL